MYSSEIERKLPGIVFMTICADNPSSHTNKFALHSALLHRYLKNRLTSGSKHVIGFNTGYCKK